MVRARDRIRFIVRVWVRAEDWGLEAITDRDPSPAESPLPNSFSFPNPFPLQLDVSDMMSTAARFLQQVLTLKLALHLP